MRTAAATLVCLVLVGPARADERGPRTAADLIEAHRVCFYECFERARKADPRLAGDLILDLVVADGTLARSGVRAPDAQVALCVDELLDRLAFPMAAGRVTVKRTFHLAGPTPEPPASRCACDPCDFPSDDGPPAYPGLPEPQWTGRMAPGYQAVSEKGFVMDAMTWRLVAVQDASANRTSTTLDGS